MKKLVYAVLFLLPHLVIAMEENFTHPILYPYSNAPDYERESIYKKIVTSRIAQNLKGAALIENYNNDMLNLLERLASRRSMKLVEKILEQDPSLIHSKGLHEAMRRCVYDGNIEFLKYFIDKGGDVNAQLSNQTLLHHKFLYSNYLSIINLKIKLLLLINNANPNMQDSFGKTPLTEVVASEVAPYVVHYIDSPQSKDEDALKKLLSIFIVSGADPFIETSNNIILGSKNKLKNAIEISQAHGKPEIAQYILDTIKQRDDLLAAVKKGEDIDFINTNGISRRHVRDIKGNSLLYYAIKHNNSTVATKLLYLWPDLLNQPNFDGQRVLDVFPTKSIKYTLGIN